MRKDKISETEAVGRLKHFPNLNDVLGKGWIIEEYKKPVEQWSVITGWISEKEYFFKSWLEDLDYTLEFFKTHVAAITWETIKKKICTHTNRSNSHGTLAELAICRFLAENEIAFELEKNLNLVKNKDVDISAYMPNEERIHIEVQSLLYSEKSNLAAEVAADYQTSYSVNLDREVFRVKRKIYEKTLKFTENDITFVAIRSLELGLDEGFWAIKKAVSEIFQKQNQDNGKDVERDVAINRFVDGVIWFELESGNKLLPSKRQAYLNPNSPYRINTLVLKFCKLWSNKSTDSAILA